MNAEAVRTASRRQLSEKDNFISHFFVRDVIVFYTRQFLFQFIEFVVMSGKECFWLMGTGMQVFGDAPGDRNAIVR